MTRIAFFGPDAGDAAVRRRVQGFQDDGVDVVGFMMKRRPETQADWKNVDLGITEDGALLKRIGSIFQGARIASRHKEELRNVSAIYARNLDMLICAFLTKRLTNLETPVIYECLDIHRIMVREDAVGATFRRIEGDLLKRSKGLVVSSPGFLKHYFAPRQGGRYHAYLLENKLAQGADYGLRPAPQASDPDAPLKIGWVGMFRCQRSFDLLCALADAAGDKVSIRLHGMPTRRELPLFEPEIDKRDNMIFAGRYRSPEDLEDVYRELDVVWAGDFMDTGRNSDWLLPNRIYEGGRYLTPSLTHDGTETANWIKDNDVGFIVREPLEPSLLAFVDMIQNNRSLLLDKQNRLAAMDDVRFVQAAGDMQTMLKEFGVA